MVVVVVVSKEEMLLFCTFFHGVGDMEQWVFEFIFLFVA